MGNALGFTAGVFNFVARIVEQFAICFDVDVSPYGMGGEIQLTKYAG